MFKRGFFVRLSLTSLGNTLLLGLGLFVFLNYPFIQAVRAELRKRDDEVLQQIQRRVDGTVTAMRGLAAAISVSARFTPYDLPDSPYKAIDGIRDLRSSALLNPALLRVGVAYAVSDYILSDGGSLTKGTAAAHGLPPYEAMADDDNLAAGFVVLDDSIVFLYRYPLSPGATRRGVIFFAMRTDAFIGGFRGEVAGVDRHLRIVHSATGRTLYSSMPPGRHELPASATRAYEISRFVSDDTGFAYEIATPRAYFDRVLDQLRLPALGVLGLLLVLSAGVGLLAAQYNTFPLRRLLGLVAGGRGPEDFGAIESWVAGAVAASRRAEREAFFLRVLEGSFATLEELRAVGAGVGIALPHERLCYVLVHAGADGGRASAELAVDGGVFVRQGPGDGEQQVWIYNGSEITREAVEELRARAYGGGGHAPTVGVGTLACELRDLPCSYLDALTALSYRLVEGTGRIIFFRDMPRAATADSVAMEATLRPLESALGERDADKLAAAAKELLAQASRLSLSASRSLLWQSLAILRGYGLVSGELRVGSLAEADTHGRLLEVVAPPLRDAAEAAARTWKPAAHPLVAALRAAIERRYTDSQLSLESLAVECGFSVGHMCRTFKRKEGLTIQAHIAALRLALARRLLETGDLPVGDIVRKVGYLDHASFSRSFRAHFGMSPLQCRARAEGPTGATAASPRRA